MIQSFDPLIHKWCPLVKTYLILLSLELVRSKTLFLKCQCMLEYISIHFFYFANKGSTLTTVSKNFRFSSFKSSFNFSFKFSFGRCLTSFISYLDKDKLFNDWSLIFLEIQMQVLVGLYTNGIYMLNTAD